MAIWTVKKLTGIPICFFGKGSVEPYCDCTGVAYYPEEIGDMACRSDNNVASGESQ